MSITHAGRATDTGSSAGQQMGEEEDAQEEVAEAVQQQRRERLRDDVLNMVCPSDWTVQALEPPGQYFLEAFAVVVHVRIIQTLVTFASYRHFSKHHFRSFWDACGLFRGVPLTSVRGSTCLEAYPVFSLKTAVSLRWLHAKGVIRCGANGMRMQSVLAPSLSGPLPCACVTASFAWTLLACFTLYSLGRGEFCQHHNYLDTKQCVDALSKVAQSKTYVYALIFNSLTCCCVVPGVRSVWDTPPRSR